MTSKAARWYAVAIALIVINAVGGVIALGSGELAHTAVHAVLLVASWSWARRLRLGGGGSEPARLEGDETLAALEGDVSRLQQELNETQERLDFVERLLAQKPRVGGAK
ncbi:MAG TPA: hypothetical protein VGJ83_00710 [Gemmatimonadales bacterium]|jgi:hypothetical protein